MGKNIFFIVLLVGSLFSFIGCSDSNNPSHPATSSSSTSSWKALGTAGFYPNPVGSMSLFVYNGTPYVAFQDATNGGPVVMDYNGSTWVTVGTANFLGVGNNATFNVLYVYNGTPYLAFEDGSKTFKASVMSFSGSTWSYVGNSGFSGGQFGTLSFYVNSSGVPYVAYQDYTTTPTVDETTVMTCPASTWVAVGSAGITPGNALPTELFPYNNQPALAFGDTTHSSEASALVYSGTTWGALGTAPFSTEASAAYGNVVVSSGTPYAVFAQNPGGFFLYSYSGTAWSRVGSAYANGGNSSAYTSLAMNGTTPYVAFQDGTNSNKASVVVGNGSSWTNVGAAGFSSGPVTYTSMGIYNGIPCVAFADGGNGGKPTVMVYQ